VMRFACTSCPTLIEARPEHAGKRGKCPRCGAEFIIPGPDPAAGPVPPPPSPMAEALPATPEEPPPAPDAPPASTESPAAPTTPPKLHPAVYVLCLIPLGLAAVGGLIGGAIGGAAAGLNLAVFRTRLSMPRKVLAACLLTVATVIVAFLVLNKALPSGLTVPAARGPADAPAPAPADAPPKHQGPKVSLKAMVAPGLYRRKVAETRESEAAVDGQKRPAQRQTWAWEVNLFVPAPAESGERDVRVFYRGLKAETGSPETSFDTAQFKAAPGQAFQDLARAAVGAEGLIHLKANGNIAGVEGFDRFWNERARTNPADEPACQILKARAGDLFLGDLVRDDLDMAHYRPVGPGDRWKSARQVEAPLSGTLNIEMEFRLKDIEDTPAGRVAIIGFLGSMKKEKPSSATINGAVITVLDSDTTVTGEARFNMDIGLVEHETAEMSGTMHITVSQDGTTVRKDTKSHIAVEMTTDVGLPEVPLVEEPPPRPLLGPGALAKIRAPLTPELAKKIKALSAHWQPTVGPVTDLLAGVVRSDAWADDGSLFLGAQRPAAFRKKVQVPVTFRVILQSEGGQIYLSCVGGLYLFNAGENNDELWVDRVAEGAAHKPRIGLVPAMEWATLEVVIRPDVAVIYVNGEERYRTRGEFPKIEPNFTFWPQMNQMKVLSVEMATPGEERPAAVAPPPPPPVKPPAVKPPAAP
jgi:hypothetical protein